MESMRTRRRPTVLLENPNSRRGREGLREARRLLAEGGVPIDHRIAAEGDASVLDQAKRAVASGAGALLVAGGDGTLSAAANALVGSSCALGVLPLGTANDFARSLGIPAYLPAACEVVARGAWREIDLGRVEGGRCFLNSASFGVSTAIARRLTRSLKRWSGPMAYPLAAIPAAVAPQRFQLRLEAGEVRWTLDTLQMVIGNSRYAGGGTPVAPNARVDDGLLAIHAIEAPEPGRLREARTLWRLARVGLLLRRGRHLLAPWVHDMRAERLRVEASPPQEIEADGERISWTPATFSVLPRALRVLAPDGCAPRAAGE